MSPPVRRGLEAYAAGVNAFLDSRRGALPPEFLLLRFAPEPWRPADTLVWGKLMDLLLAGNYRGELLRARLARTLSPEELAFLYPEYPDDAPTTLAALATIYRRLPLDRLYAALPPAVGPIYASNNWVVDGAHSASGKPLLANDPHLAFGAPGFWYLARLKTPEREIAGGTVAGDAVCRDRPQRPDRLGLHDDRRRCRGSLYREARSRRPRPLSDPGRQRRLCDPGGDDRGARRRTGRADHPLDPPRPGAVRRAAARTPSKRAMCWRSPRRF